MELSYLDIAIKLTMGLLSLVLVINISGKGNLAPTSAMDQVLNYVLGGIVGGNKYFTIFYNSYDMDYNSFNFKVVKNK